MRVRTEWSYWKKNQSSLGYLQAHILCPSLCSRRLEVVGTRKNRPVMGRHMRGEGVPTRKAHENCFNLHSVSADTSNNIGWEAPEGKSNCARRENCQLIVHGQRSEGLILHHQLLIPPNGITEVQVSEVTSIWFNGTKIYVAVVSKKKWSVQTVFMMERIDIWYALAEVVGDKRFVESMKWRSEEIFFAQENLVTCVVDGMHTIKTWTGLMKNYETLMGGMNWKHLSLVYRPQVCYLCLVAAAENILLQFVFWSLHLHSKTCLFQKRLPLRAVKAMFIFHEHSVRWCLYSCD